MPSFRSTLPALAGAVFLIAIPAARADERSVVFKVDVKGQQVTDWTFEESDGQMGCGAGMGAGSGRETLRFRSTTKPFKVRMTLSDKRGRPYLGYAGGGGPRQTSVDVPLTYTYSRTGSRERTTFDDNGACVRRASHPINACGETITGRGGIEIGFWKKDFRYSGATDDPRSQKFGSLPDRDLLHLVGLDDPRWTGDGWDRVTSGCPTSQYGLHDVNTPVWVYTPAYDRRFIGSGRNRLIVKAAHTIRDQTPLLNGGSAANTTKITATLTFTRVG